MPSEIRRLARDILQDPVTVQVGNTNTKSVLVFTRTKHRAKSLGKKLVAAGYRSASLQGNLSQTRRQAALDGFRDGKFQILVATDIAARGIDVTQISHVINYDIPSTPEAYIHRIGRTGRATRTGEAFTLVTVEDKYMVNAINRIIGSKIEQRILSNFDYEPPMSDIESRSQWKRKPKRKFSGAKKRQG
jgi:ATP-dependent RNA helicase RhlE